MFERKSSWLVISFLILFAVCLRAGDLASFVDLGFSPDGRTYMFAQYGVRSGTLTPWADLYVVDVPRNDFVPGGQISYVHTTPVRAGQDGSGALYRLLAQNAALAEQYGISFLFQGYPLYISLDSGSAVSTETIEFRDFEQNNSYRAVLSSRTEGSGASMNSSFSINLECTARDGSKKNYVVGDARIKRPLIHSYTIKKVIMAPKNGFMVLVIEMKKQNNNSFDIRYMVETLCL